MSGWASNKNRCQDGNLTRKLGCQFNFVAKQESFRVKRFCGVISFLSSAASQPLFDFSPQCVFQCLLKLWSHPIPQISLPTLPNNFDFSPLCVFNCLLKLWLFSTVCFQIVKLSHSSPPLNFTKIHLTREYRLNLTWSMLNQFLCWKCQISCIKQNMPKNLRISVWALLLKYCFYRAIAVKMW